MSEPVGELQRDAEARVAAAVAATGATAAHHTSAVQPRLRRVLEAMAAEHVGVQHFASVSGYGHGDQGREVLDRVFARVLQAEAAAVRLQFVSGTHAIAAALFGVLRPGDRLLALTGRPYDTLEEVIGIRGCGQGSLVEFGIVYDELPLASDGAVDHDGLAAALALPTRMVLIQRSCGYSWRPSLSGGTIAPTGGYVAGRSELVEQACCRLTAPGIGAEGGTSFDLNRLLFQGLFLAPQMVAEALICSELVAQVFSALGYAVHPRPGAARSDVIQAVRLGDPERLKIVCRAFQAASPVGSYLDPVPAPMPGYASALVMAGGTFIDGSTSEFSADAPLREPYVLFAQGGTHRAHAQIALERALVALAAAGLDRTD
jgi:cystathionine beta-lyase family protein involved in aluminum resistance